ncbi:MAG: glycosyltransferase family 4 protein [Thermaurantimonas sp.]|uniref:glycosyltransferase family 4 protein n=1 Tax=Thermaurantimonas sp. TaxID=2681568 RepID=UPI00391D961C
MKVLILIRRGYREYIGGDTIQVITTAEYLRKYGISVEIVESGEALSGRRYDILHFFNLGRPYDLYPYLNSIRSPLIISSLFVDYREYDVRGRFWPMRDIMAFVGRDNAEYLKASTKMLLGQLPYSAKQYLIDGHKKAICKVLQNADCLITATGSELERIYNYCNLLPAFTDVVPLGIDPIFFTKDNPWHRRKGILSVGRLEGLKNQANLIKAADNLDAPLTLVGKPGKNSFLYNWYLLWLAGDRVTFAGYVRPEKLLDLYLEHRVHAQPSWFETTGLASLEAAAAGCRIVVTNRGDTAEVFGVYALYCDPVNLKDITENLMLALETPPAPEQRDYFYENYSWEKSTKKLIEVYRRVLDK